MKLLLLFCFLYSACSFAQDEFRVTSIKKVTIPFQLINNLIFVPVTINGTELTFLLDSGVNETILFSLENKEVNFNDVAKLKFSGLGESIDIEGLRSDNNEVSVSKDYDNSNHTIFIILDERINFSSHVGIPVHGIIGYHFFKNSPITIDYVRKKITVHPPSEFLVPKKSFREFDLSIEGNKPYILADIEMTSEKKPAKMLLDLGNSDAVWLFPKLIPDFVYNRPNIEDYLGQGFNGDIFGKRSRIHGLYLSDFSFNKPLVAMPDEYSIQNLTLVPGRKGSIGSEILRRFKVIFDCPQQKIYLKKNRHYSDPFLFNSSGLDLQHDGMEWESDLVNILPAKSSTDPEGVNVFNASAGFQYNFVLKPKYSIAGCRKNSPCDQAGLRKNDKIIKVNRKNAGSYTLQKLNNLLKQEDGKTIDFEIERNNEILRFTIVLKDPIPYQNEN